MASNLITLTRNSCPILIRNLMGQIGQNIIRPRAVRFLYSPAALGIDGYSQQRERTKNQLSNIASRFREKMIEYTADDAKNMVFTEDLKNMLHIAENDEDVSLVIKMMKRFNQQNQQLRFGNFVFGPVIMRMFYYLNKYDEALNCFRAPELEGLFDQVITYHILLDLLYENQQYDKILEAFEIIKDRQIEGMKFAKNVIVLVLAACYKINTKETMKYALNLWTELQGIGHQPMRRATTFCAALVLNQGEPGAALEVLSTARNINYTTVRNLKVAALVALNRVDDAIPLLKSIIHEDSASEGPIQTFNKDILEQVQVAVDKSNNADLKLEFNRLMKYFQEQGHISDTNLEEQLCQEIAAPPVMENRSNENFIRRQPQFSRFRPNARPNNRERIISGNIRRPGLADL